MPLNKKWKAIFNISITLLLVLSIITGGLYYAKHKESEESDITYVSYLEEIKENGFKIKINSVKIVDYVIIDNYNTLKQDNNNKYLIINVSFINIETSPKRLKSEPILVNRYFDTVIHFYEPIEINNNSWWPLNENINPDVTETINILFKIPSNFYGDLFLTPDFNKHIAIVLPNEVYEYSDNFDNHIIYDAYFNQKH